ncbi:hypothetical protein [Mesorhizobium sp. M0058]|uniref:hypothetical protein n=1 Tax=Mesorhizobium sp. M0058 TaxID=2956865 RepID=UPI003335411C
MITSDTAEKIEILKSLRLASPISPFTFWSFEFVALTEARGLPYPIDARPLFDAGLSPERAADKYAKRWQMKAA